MRSILIGGTARQPVSCIALLWLLGCGSTSDPAQPVPDPEWLAAQRRQPARAAGTYEEQLAAGQQAALAQQAQLEPGALAIERGRGDPARLLREDEIDYLLGYYCGACHLPIAEPAQTNCGMQYVDDMPELIATGKVVPGNAESSRLVLRMRRGEMPPVSWQGAPVPEATVDLIAEFIDSLAPGVLPAE